MSKTIIAWIDGAAQSIEVAETSYAAQEPTIEDRVSALEKQQGVNIVTKTISIPAANWTGDASPYSQVVEIDGVTENSKIDLQPDSTQIEALQNAEITLMLQNDSGIVTAWAIGNKPTEDYTMQVLIQEVTVA